MPKAEAHKLKLKVFNKLEKHARMSKLERALNLKEEHLHNWLNAWEGELVEEEIPMGMHPYPGQMDNRMVDNIVKQIKPVNVNRLEKGSI